MMRAMPIGMIENLGRNTKERLAEFGDFCIFVAQTIASLGRGVFQWRNIREIFPQMYEVGTKSVPVISITGAFIGMVLAVEAYSQFKSIGQENHLGSIINVSVVKQIGPVLAAVMLAGRVGGSLTAELGTMNVTEQLDALRVMGADPVRVLVVPRFLACILMTPLLTIYSDALGALGGWFVTVKTLGVPSAPYWEFARVGVDLWTLNEGLVKSVFFGDDMRKGNASGAKTGRVVLVSVQWRKAADNELEGEIGMGFTFRIDGLATKTLAPCVFDAAV